MVLTGTIVKGVGQASYFTGLGWVQEQCLAKLGFKPYPGTLNVELSAQDVRIMETCRGKGVELVSPDPAFCNARALPVSVQSLPGALILPAEEVNVHGANIVEIISPVNIKDTLGVVDGQSITIALGNKEIS
jgi:CTP-dependent riboflavin kinase